MGQTSCLSSLFCHLFCAFCTAVLVLQKGRKVGQNKMFVPPYVPFAMQRWQCRVAVLAPQRCPPPHFSPGCTGPTRSVFCERHRSVLLVRQHLRLLLAKDLWGHDRCLTTCSCSTRLPARKMKRSAPQIYKAPTKRLHWPLFLSRNSARVP